MTRAIVEGKLDNYHYRVRIPILNKLKSSIGATPTNELAIATIAVVPGMSPKFRSGDIVFVDYEEGDTSKPVIVGRLFNEAGSQIVSDGSLDSLQVDVNTQLSAETTIGSVSAQNISYLQGTTSNIQYQFDQNDSQHEDFVNKITNLTTEVSEVSSQTEQITSSVQNFETTLNSIKQNITNVESDVQDIQQELSGPLILNRISYGTSAPSSVSNPVEGQLYLYIQ